MNDREESLSYVANIAINLQGHDLLQQWKMQIKIPPISEANHKIKNTFEKNIKRCYQEQSQTFQVVHKQSITTDGLLKISFRVQITKDIQIAGFL